MMEKDLRLQMKKIAMMKKLGKSKKLSFTFQRWSVESKQPVESNDDPLKVVT